MEAALRESEERLRFALESSRTGTWEVDFTNHTIIRSLEHDRIFGYKELLPMWTYEMFLEHVLPDDRATVDAKFHHSAETRSDYSIECRIRRRDGEVRWIWAAGRHPTDEAGIPLRRMTGIVQDITERKQYEEEREQLLTRVLRSNKELEQFAYIASHDLQEPLRTVASFTRLLEKRYADKLDSDAKEFIHFAMDGALRMQKLIDDLLTYSRVGSQDNPFKPSDCNHLLDQAISNLRVAIEENHAVITRNNLPTINCNSLQMVQLFQNLIGNAIKFHSADIPQIHISAEHKDDEWLFSIQDNGIGIDPQYKDRIFKIFQRLHSRDEYPGTGIGLALCMKIVELHNGKIWMESELGKGATFYFSLPA
jgi:PAS domain S-box-containing protein